MLLTIKTVYVTDWLENKLPSQKEIIEDQDLCIVFANSDSGEGYEHYESKPFILDCSHE